MEIKTLGLIGFGEVGGILATELSNQGVNIKIYDKLMKRASSRSALTAKAQHLNVELCESAIDAAAGAQLIISAVTAGSALEAAVKLFPHLHPGQIFMDLNSVSPATKRAAYEAASRYGVEYIDAAVMAPVPPKRLQTPILLGGAQALKLKKALEELGFNVRTVANTIGVASAIKMCRSIIIKGLEALTTECMSTARQYGAEEIVLASLHESFPSLGWNKELPHYLISRVAEHGLRRAEEMDEVARTLSEVGIAPEMTLAIAATQRAFADALSSKGIGYATLEPFDWMLAVDKIYSS
ncbi:DUF1932 domain-containing protein [Pseudomonas alloputida]|uniref:6-phosphogluconate dehydrogenase, NAD-binding protein n=1 Tax=Pseudomonas putida (strain ATCC 700007 / DSM 6899 / JCM 31910 / BCRC 17059 / LMG 24140 / F1) TaxID=351746 RepID=A5W057_PSEP1|nr:MULTISPECIES: DUF1932 domain-containing protein [Pseudomonas]MDD2000042.1 NAD(P)-binding domain-containing protein [Pseudomonas putida]MPT20803.1 NAD(P)-dependent oxidoreductase [Pseudomonas sp.]HDS1789267.1 NAD(P)-dependent oxidoreductase [Pseudomonas putida]